MRPVNLIPSEERRGESAPTRTGALSYVIIGVLALALVAVVGLVFFNKKVSDGEAQVAALEVEEAAASERAASLASFTSFQQLRDARVQTVDSLARSRFDWERVMRELSIVIPKHVWLTNLTGTVAPEVEVDDAAAVPLRESIPGPAIELVGCGRSQRDVARLIAALHDIDGVTRVTAVDSVKPEAATSSSGTTDASNDVNTSDDCSTRNSIPKFQVVAAFDAVPVPASASAATPVAPEATTTATEESTAVDPEAETQTTEQEGVAEASRRTENARQLAGGGD